MDIAARTPPSAWDVAGAATPEITALARGAAAAQYLGKYKVLSRMGKGSHGHALRVGVDTSGWEGVAKVTNLPTGQQGHGGYADDCNSPMHEVEILRQLKHSSTISLVDCFAQHTSFVIVTDLCPHGDLDRHLRAKAAAGTWFSEAEVLRTVAQLALAIEYLHGLGITHNDIKPSNILVLDDGRVKLGDFGLATAHHQHSSGKAPATTLAPHMHDPHPQQPTGVVDGSGMFDTTTAGGGLRHCAPSLFVSGAGEAPAQKMRSPALKLHRAGGGVGAGGTARVQGPTQVLVSAQHPSRYLPQRGGTSRATPPPPPPQPASNASASLGSSLSGSSEGSNAQSGRTTPPGCAMPAMGTSPAGYRTPCSPAAPSTPEFLSPVGVHVAGDWDRLSPMWRAGGGCLSDTSSHGGRSPVFMLDAHAQDGGASDVDPTSGLPAGFMTSPPMNHFTPLPQHLQGFVPLQMQQRCGTPVGLGPSSFATPTDVQIPPALRPRSGITPQATPTKPAGGLVLPKPLVLGDGASVPAAEQSAAVAPARFGGGGTPAAGAALYPHAAAAVPAACARDGLCSAMSTSNESSLTTATEWSRSTGSAGGSRGGKLAHMKGTPYYWPPDAYATLVTSRGNASADACGERTLVPLVSNAPAAAGDATPASPVADAEADAVILTNGAYDAFKADVWALGVVMFEMAALARPVCGQNVRDLAAAVRGLQTDALWEHSAWPTAQAGFSKEYFETLAGALAHDAASRPTAAGLLNQGYLQRGLGLYRSALLRSTKLTKEEKRAMCAEIAAHRPLLSYPKAAAPDAVLLDADLEKLSSGDRWRPVRMILTRTALVSQGKPLPLVNILTASAHVDALAFCLCTKSGKEFAFRCGNAGETTRWVGMLETLLAGQ